MAHAHCMLDTKRNEHTLRLCNTSDFPLQQWSCERVSMLRTHTLRAFCMSCSHTPAGSRPLLLIRLWTSMERNGMAIGRGEIWGEKEAAIDFLSCHVFRCDSAKSEPRTEPMHCCHPIPDLPNIFIWSLESNCC